MTLCSFASGLLFLLGCLTLTHPVLAKVSTKTSLFVVLTPSTGGVNSSFAEISVVVFTDGTGTAADLSRGGTVAVFDQGTQLGTSKLSPVNGSSLPGACAGFLLVPLSAGDHNLTAKFTGNETFAESSSWPFYVTAGQAIPGKHDVGVPAPFSQGQESESSLGVSIHPTTGVDAAQSGAQSYANIAQVCHAAGACLYSPWPDSWAVMSFLSSASIKLVLRLQSYVERSLLQDSSFQKGSASWILEGDATVSAFSSSDSTATARLGRGSYLWQALWDQVVPLTAYVIEVQSSVGSGNGLAGATFFSGSAQKLSAQGIRLSPSGGGTQRGTLTAPPGSYFAALWIGNWVGSTLQVSSLRFGPLSSGPLPVDCSVPWRELPKGGVGINTNYLMDISPEWRSPGGPTYLESLKAMGISSLRYPGGEEANSYEWAPPPYTAQTKAQPVLTTGSGFPGGDWLFYDRFRGTFQSSVMSFDQLMDICAALNIRDPYLVINHDSVNIGGPRASTEWGYFELKQAAVAWAQYIVQRNYTARHFEFSNESWKTDSAAQYASALLDWAPAIKAVHPRALLGANGPAGRAEVGDKDQGIPWWPQVLGAASSVVDFVATHPYPVYGWDYLDYVSGRAPNLQQGVIEADLAINTYAAPEDRERIRVAVTETGVIDWRDKWQNGQSDLGHALVAFDIMANILSHPRVDVALFWTTRWRFGGFSPSNNAGSVADALMDDNSLTAVGKALALFGKYFRAGTLMSTGSSQGVRSWAVQQSSTSWVLLLLNKAFTVTTQDVIISQCVPSRVGRVWQLTGTNHTDAQPILREIPNTVALLTNGSLSIALPAVSITVLEF